MIPRSKAILPSAFLVGLFLTASQASAAPPAAKITPAAVESVSQTTDVPPGPFQQELATYERPQIRHVSVSMLINFSSASGQWVSILAAMPSGGYFPVATYYSTSGSQQFITVDLNAATWVVRAYNDSNVNVSPINVEFLATMLY